jgi:hypothetical protein
MPKENAYPTAPELTENAKARTFAFRAHEQLARQIESGAEKNDHSISQEIMRRLADTYRDEDLLDAANRRRYGEETAAVIEELSRVVHETSTFAATVSSVSKKATGNHPLGNDPYAAAQTVAAVTEFLRCLAPSPSEVEKARPRLIGAPAAQIAEQLLRQLAIDKARQAAQRLLNSQKLSSALSARVAAYVEGSK